MNTCEILITYLVVANDAPLDSMNPTEARVWKKTMSVAGVDPLVTPDPDWCYAQIIDANPDFETYTIAIWAVDVTMTA